MLSSNKIIKGFAWTALERFSTQFVQFILGIIIARLITPNEYGILGILLVFINISQVFIDSGLGSALIYQSSIKKEETNTIFTVNLVISLILFIIIYSFSDAIASFFNLRQLTTYLRVSSLVLIGNSLIVVPTALLKISMDFKSLAISNFLSTLISGIVGVFMAYMGYGIWALIYQLLLKSGTQAVLLLILSKWIPRLKFHKQCFNRLYNYGIKIFAASCLTKITDEGTSFLIGKVLSPYKLGIYSRSIQFASLPSTSFGAIVSSVLFPSLSNTKEDKSRFNILLKQSIIYQAFISIPLFFWLAMICDPMIRLILTNKWGDVIPILQILSLGRILFPIANISEQAMNALGRSDLFLKQQTVKMTLKFILIITALKFGIIAIAIAESIYNIILYFITNYYGRKILDYPIRKQLNDIKVFIFGATLSTIIGYEIMFLTNSLYLKILISLLTVFILYFFIVYSFKRDIILSLKRQISKRQNL